MIKITKDQQKFVCAMLTIRSKIDKNSKEYKDAEKFLEEWYKKQEKSKK